MVSAGESACVVHITVEYVRVDSALLLPEDEAMIVQGYLSPIKNVEYLIVRTPASSPELPQGSPRQSDRRNPCYHI